MEKACDKEQSLSLKQIADWGSICSCSHCLLETPQRGMCQTGSNPHLPLAHCWQSDCCSSSTGIPMTHREISDYSSSALDQSSRLLHRQYHKASDFHVSTVAAPGLTGTCFCTGWTARDPLQRRRKSHCCSYGFRCHCCFH